MWQRTTPTTLGCGSSTQGRLLQAPRRICFRPSCVAGAAAAQADARPPQSMAALEAMPPTFKRLIATGVGGSFRDVAVVQEAPMPTPGPGEVLVRMHYAGVNGGCETFRVRGEHAFAGNRARDWYPLGAEGAGVVAALGPDVAGLQVGQAVACNGAAAFAEYAVARVAMCTPVAEASPEAVALSLSALTACAALEGTAGMQAGETVVVTAAAGGTGHFAVQLAKLAGCRVVAVVGSQDKAQRLRGLGDTSPDVIIDYSREDLTAELARACPLGADLAYEGVGGAVQRAVLDHLAPTGRLLQVGYISEYPHAAPSGQGAAATAQPGAAGDGAAAAAPSPPPAPGGLPSNAELFWKGLAVERGQQRILGSVWPKDAGVIRSCKQRVFALHAAGKLVAWVDMSHGCRGVEAAADAVEYMLRGRHTGKVVLPLLS